MAFVLRAMDSLSVYPAESILGFDREGLDLLPTVGQLMGVRRYEPKPLLAPLVCEDDYGMIWGPEGGGKSLLALAMSASLTSGTPLGEFVPHEPSEVMYVDAEMTPKHWHHRVRTFEEAGLSVGQVRLLAQKWNPERLGSWDATDPAFHRDVLHLVQRSKIRLLILDTVSALHPQADEIDPRSVEPFNRLAVELSRIPCSLILVHHSNLAGRQFGTSARLRQLDWALKVSPKQARVWRTKLTLTKNRGLAALPCSYVELRRGLDVT